MDKSASQREEEEKAETPAAQQGDKDDVNRQLDSVKQQDLNRHVDSGYCVAVSDLSSVLSFLGFESTNHLRRTFVGTGLSTIMLVSQNGNFCLSAIQIKVKAPLEGHDPWLLNAPSW